MNDTVQSLDAEEESANYHFDELLNALYEHKDLILVVPSDQVQELKDGLQARKSKQNYQLRKKGGTPPAEMLVFNVYPTTDKDGNILEGQSSVRVKLRPRKSVEILSMTIPDPSI